MYIVYCIMYTIYNHSFYKHNNNEIPLRIRPNYY